MKSLSQKEIYTYLLGVVLISILQGSSIGVNGAFLDTLYYYDLYRLIEENGLIYTVTAISTQSGKFEPIIAIVFQIESFLFGPSISEFNFLIINMIALNVLLAISFFDIIKNNTKSLLTLLIIPAIIISGYLVFSKGLWFWRSFIGLFFFILFIKERNIFYKIAYISLCYLSHTSYVIFILMYLVIEFLYKKGGLAYFLILTIVSITLSLIANKFQEIFSFVVSNSDPTIFFSDGGNHAIKVWLSVFYSMTILLLLYKTAIKSNMVILYLFCLLCVAISIVSYNNYHFMNRVFLPASLMIGFLPFAFSSNNLNIKLAKIMVVLTVLPGTRLVLNLFAGNFYE